MLNRSTLMILVLVAIFIVCGLGTSVDALYTDNNTASNASSGHLNETEWVLTSLNGNSPVKMSRITLTFAEGMATGFAGCNRYGGEYTMADNGTLTILEIANTEELCLMPKGVMPQEAEYITSLSLATNYSFSEEKLEIFTASGGVLIYAPVSEERTIIFPN